MSFSSELIEQTAAGYAIDLDDPDVSLEKVEEALRWIEESPVNRHAFERAQNFMALCDHHPSLDTTELLVGNDSYRFFAGAVRRPLLAASLVFMLMAGVLVANMQDWRWPGIAGGDAANESIDRESYASRVGENRQVVLADGSAVVLGGASRIAVRYSGREREIELLRGEAYFKVARDKVRPFVLVSGQARVTAHGTMFNVKREAGASEVTLVEGVVDVRQESDRRNPPTMLYPRMQVTVADDGRVSPVTYVDTASVISWRDGILRFDDTPLKTVVSDLNRYSATPIVISSRQIEELRVSGSARIDSINDWIDGIASAFSIDVDRRDPDRIVLRPSA